MSKSTARAKRPRSSPLAESSERQCQFTLKMRESLHHELARKALDSGITMRGFIMDSLRNNGLKVLEADLIDRRRK